MKQSDIKSGDFLYPKNYSPIRYVQGHDGKLAYYQGYDEGGERLWWCYGVCELQSLAKWALRHATDDEIAMIKARNPELR